MQASVTPTANATAIDADTAGRADRNWAAAGGTTSNANTSSEPVIWLASPTAAPSSTRYSTDRARTGISRARAISGLVEANSSGRDTSSNTASAPAPTTA